MTVDLVLKVLRAVLGDDVELVADTELFGVPGFDSMALAGVVEGIEAELGVELPDDLLMPEVFETPAVIAANLVARLGKDVP
jgi:acyl carrier protein